MERASAILEAIAGCALLYLAIKALSSGRVWYKTLRTQRDRNPIRYWLQVSGYLISGVALILVGILGALKK
jgi:uncharacterized membrane protein YfcA